VLLNRNHSLEGGRVGRAEKLTKDKSNMQYERAQSMSILSPKMLSGVLLGLLLKREEGWNEARKKTPSKI